MGTASLRRYPWRRAVFVASATVAMAVIPVPTPTNLRRIDTGGSDLAFFDGDWSQATVIGNSLPGTWRPFSPGSPWNTPIASSAAVHPDSAAIMAAVLSKASHIYMARSYSIPVWVVNADNIPPVRVRSDSIFDTWDQNFDGWSDVGVPITPSMWAENTTDGHICIVDPFRKLAYEMSKFSWMADGTPTCTTFNIWDLSSNGYGDPNQGQRWKARGGRGSGFPEIAGLFRPEELASGEIRHALVFSYPENRIAADGSNIFLSPACRSDGKFAGSSYPIEGMRFQLSPTVTEGDFDTWGLNREGKIVARALQKYGMFLGDNGGAMGVYPQLLNPDATANQAAWEAQFPGLFANVGKIPTNRFRVIDTGTPTVKN